MYSKIIKIVAGLLILSFFAYIILIASKKENPESLTTVTWQGQDDDKGIGQVFEGISTKPQDQYIKAAENDKLEMYINGATLGLRIQDKATGYIWSSNMEPEDVHMGRLWKNFCTSGVTAYFMDNNQATRQVSSIEDSVGIKIQKKASGVIADISFNEQGMNLTVDITLDGDAVDIKVPYAKINETSGDSHLQSITLFPFLGATKQQEVAGYMFIPDGSGALISLNRKSLATIPYTKRIYGKDPGIGDIYERTRPLNIPVFGMVHGEGKNAYIAYLKSGATYAEIDAYPSGAVTDYNWVGSKFIYREQYNQPINDKGGAITLNQKNKNKFDIDTKYMFISGKEADYVGMAKRYQSELVQEGVLKKNKVSSREAVPVMLEFLADESKEAFLGKEQIPMTTVGDMDNILKDLSKSGLKNMTVQIDGWNKEGISQTSARNFPLEKELGTENEWKRFISYWENAGVPIYMSIDYMAVVNNFRGYEKKI